MAVGQAAALQRGMGLVAQFDRMAAGGLQAEHRHVGGLVVVHVLAGGLAQGVRFLRHVEDVVHHLEGHAQRRAVVGQCTPGAVIGLAAGGTHLHAGQQQRAGLAAVHVAQFGLIRPAAGPRWPGRWPGRRPCRHGPRHAPAANTGAPAAPAPDRTRLGPHRRGQDLEGQRVHGIAGQHGLRLAELHVHGGLAPPQHVVVHAGHVVVHQRIGVDQLHRHRGAHGRLALRRPRPAPRPAPARGAGACRRRARRSAWPRPAGRGLGRHPGLQGRFNRQLALAHPGSKSKSDGFMRSAMP